ncbi:MAG: hypothetical protein DCC71_12365 [Proteobacteria bacterium]|nr:MAG: hypothetical protein DCC71_12365 [Pseudomonadota bacterium]
MATAEFEPLLDASRDPVAQARAIPRVGADLAAEIHSGDFAQPLAARTRDVGVGGVCVATVSPFSYRSVRRVTLELPGGRVALAARGSWQVVEHAENVVLTGIEFTEVDERTLHTLWDVVMDGGKTLARFLHGGSDLAHLGADEAVGIAHASRWKEVPAGRYIYRSDVARSGASSIFLVHDGAVVLQLRVRGAIDRAVARLGPGRLFGGLPLIAEAVPGESAVAQTDVRLLEIHGPAFRFLCSGKPWLAQRLAQAVTAAYARRAGALLAELADKL